MRNLALAVLLAVALGAPAPGAGPPADLPKEVTAAAAEISGERLHGDVAFLADDLLEGRGTGTRGYDLAAKYVANRYATLGLDAGGTDAYLQPVPFRCALIDQEKSSIALTGPSGERPLVIATDVMLGSDMVRTSGSVTAGLVFVGYGVAAPELGHDDFAGVDVRGKVLVAFRGAPPRFAHNERAFYSSSLVKEQMAVAHGAIGIVSILKPSDAARSPWARSVRQGRMSSCKWTDAQGVPANTQPTLELGAYLSDSGVQAIFAGAPISYAKAAEEAEASVVHSFPLAWGVKAHRETRHTQLTSPNVVGILRGSDPKLAGEAVVVSAHLDHLGIGTPVTGKDGVPDPINNGAYDNASGTAMMLEVARAFTRLSQAGQRPKRTVIFLAVTGEEKGLQGSDYFARHAPPAGLEVVGNVNVDEILMLRPITSVIGFGAEHTSLGAQLERAAALVGFTVVPDPMPEEVIFVRSDQFSFVKQGVPGIFPVSNMDGGPAAQAADRKWNLEVYHSPNDDMTQVFDWESGAKFTRMAFFETWFAADAAARPSWNPGDFFGEKFGRARGK